MKTLLYDVTHTSHCEVNSGIQRTVRRLAKHWPTDGQLKLQPVVYDSYAHFWRMPDKRESALLDFDAGRQPGRKRGPAWNLWQRTRGRVSRHFFYPNQIPETGADAFLCPELFAGDRRANNFGLMRSDLHVTGPLAAIFYDMIPVDLPEHMPQKVVANFEHYLEQLLRFDVIAAISEDSRDRLKRYWRERRISQTPEVMAVPLGVDQRAWQNIQATGYAAPENAAPLVLSVCTLEGRKNHMALLDACEALWQAGLCFRLRLIGMLNKETGHPVALRIDKLKKAGRPLEWWSNADDNALGESYGQCAFTVYPSLYEGFGLPVLESLSYGRPCVCSGLTAMSEIVHSGGGCLATGEPTATSIAEKMRILLTDGSYLKKLTQEASVRKIRSWNDYAKAMRDEILKRCPAAPLLAAPHQIV